ncbi:hypothetical protein V2J09_012300 [Rumex salicifolius]
MEEEEEEDEENSEKREILFELKSVGVKWRLFNSSSPGRPASSPPPTLSYLLLYNYHLNFGVLLFSPLLFLFLSSLLLSALSSSLSSDESDDILNRQVLPGAVDAEDSLLNADHQFSLFKSKFNRNYASKEEHDHRFSVFKANLRRTKRNQLLDPTAAHGFTKFSDLTPREFRQNFLWLNRQPKRRFGLPIDAHQAPILPTNDLPTEFDWREHGAVTEVKDQWTESNLLLAMTALSLCVDLVMNMKEEREIKFALNAKPDSSIGQMFIKSCKKHLLLLMATEANCFCDEAETLMSLDIYGEAMEKYIALLSDKVPGWIDGHSYVSFFQTKSVHALHWLCTQISPYQSRVGDSDGHQDYFNG